MDLSEIIEVKSIIGDYEINTHLKEGWRLLAIDVCSDEEKLSYTMAVVGKLKTDEPINLGLGSLQKYAK